MITYIFLITPFPVLTKIFFRKYEVHDHYDMLLFNTIFLFLFCILCDFVVDDCKFQLLIHYYFAEKIFVILVNLCTILL